MDEGHKDVFIRSFSKLSIILERWDKRAKSETNQQRRRELKTCCKIIRDWRYIKKITDGFHPDAYWDAGKGVVIGENTYTYDFSEDEGEIIVRDVEGNIIDRKRFGD